MRRGVGGMSCWFDESNEEEKDLVASGKVSLPVLVVTLISADFNSPYISTSHSGSWWTLGWSRVFMTDGAAVEQRKEMGIKTG